MKRFTLHCLASSLHRCQHYINRCRNRHKTGQNTYVKAKTTMFFGFATETMEITNFLEIANGIHRFIASMR
jgi:hypothetical protein